MAGRAGRTRKARGRYEAQSRDLSRQMQLLQGQISAYQWLSSGGPQSSMRTVVQPGGKHKPYRQFQAFTFWAPEQLHAKRQPKGRIPGLIASYKSKAINAELYGIPALTAQIEGRAPFDPTSVGSRRKIARGSALKAAKASGVSMSKVTGSQALKLQSEGKLLGAATVKAQQELSDKTGVVTFDLMGNISTVPNEGPINFEALGLGGFDPKSKSGQHMKKITQELLESRAPEQMTELQDKEAEIRKEIKVLEEIQAGSLEPNGKASTERYKNIDRLRGELADVESLQGVVSSAYSMGDHQALMKAYTKQYEDQTGVKEKVAFDFMMYSDPKNPVIKQQIASNQVTVERHENIIKNISTDLTMLRNMKKNKKDTTEFIESIKNKYDLELNSIQSTETNIITALREKKKLHQKTRQDIKSQQKTLAVKMLGDMSNSEKTAYVKKQHAAAKEKKRFEDLTGIDTKGKTESQSMAEWLVSIGAARELKKPDFRGRPSIETAWYQSWLANDQFLTIDPDQRQLSLYGETDSKTAGQLSNVKSVLSKYGEWKGESSKFATDVIGNWKTDLTRYYNEYVMPTNVTKEQVAENVWGTRKIEGDSFVGYVAHNMGGVRGGAYWSQDVRKLMKGVKEHESSLEEKIAARKELLKQHIATRESKLGIITESQKLISQEVSSSLSGEKPSTINQSLRDQLKSKSNELYTASYNKAATEAELEYLEKSLEKTIKEREGLTEKLREQEAYDMQGDTRPVKKRVAQSPGRPSLKSFSKRKSQAYRSISRSSPSEIQRRQTRRKMRRRDGLGGLVV